MRERILGYSKAYHELMGNEALKKQVQMPGNSYFLEDGSVLTLPRDDGDSRYPYGKDGFNFWAYSSGAMHCNEGLFSLFLRPSEGGEPKIAFYATLKNEQTGENEVVSLLPIPILLKEKQGVIRYCVLTQSAAYYLTEVDEVLFAIRVYANAKRQICFTLTMENTGDSREIALATYFNPFIKHSLFENSTDKWFRKCEFIPGEMLGDFIIETYEERDRWTMSTNYGMIRKAMGFEGGRFIRQSATTSRNQFIGGERSSLHTPKAVYEGSFDRNLLSSSFTETAIAADMTSIQVDHYARMDILCAYTFEEQEKDAFFKEAVDASKMDAEHADIESKEENTSDGLSLKFHDSMTMASEGVLNHFMEHLKKQVEFCSVIKGYIQLSSFSLIGIRDVFQALEGLVYWQPEIVRSKMLEAFNFVAPDGRCPRQYSLPVHEGSTPAMDLRPFIDQGVWVISTVMTYLRMTKDYEFLNEYCGYYEILDEDKHLVKKSEKRSSVLQHLMEIMGYLLRNRDVDGTECIYALYGDWNDALNGLGVTKKPGMKYGNGVSVMATLQVYQNLEEMIELLSLLDGKGYEKQIHAYQSAHAAIQTGLEKYALISNGNEERILHGWGEDRSYLLGSFADPDGISRDGLTSNAFWVLSGMYDLDTTKKKTILGAYNRLESKYGMKTFEPAFSKNTPGVGRIPNLPAGTAENGATYIHASMFAVLSLFKMGESLRAWEQLLKLLPVTHESTSHSPFVMPNSYGYNEELNIDGESMGDWQTGSSNVLLKGLIRFAFGFEPHLKGFYVQPAIDQPFGKLEITLNYLGVAFHLEYQNLHKGLRSYSVNGQEVKGIYNEAMGFERLWIDDHALKGLANFHILIQD